MKKRTRIKLAAISAFILLGLTIFSITKGMENLAISCVSSIMVIVSFYIHGETKRPSNN